MRRSLAGLAPHDGCGSSDTTSPSPASSMQLSSIGWCQIVRHRQHRTGMLWVINRHARESIDTALQTPLDGIDRDADGRPTGKLWRLDSWLRDQLPPHQPDLAALAGRTALGRDHRCHRHDPFRSPRRCDPVSPRLTSDAPRIDVMLSTAPVLVDIDLTDGALVGPVKLFIDEHSPPDLDSVIAVITSAHSYGRTAVHAVTRAALAFAVAAWREPVHVMATGSHGAVVPPDLAPSCSPSACRWSPSRRSRRARR